MSRVLTLLLLLPGATAGSTAEERWFEPRHAEAGRPLYVQHCAACHGDRGQGAPQWQRRNPDGSMPPPPLNGTGHAWHHPLKALIATITHGQGTMPAWGSKLQTAEMLAIIAWFQSQWPDEIYAAWARMNRIGG
jgi:mono/diheme cytochrome c family protein